MAAYSWTPDYILWRLSFTQVMLWYERAIEILTGEIEDKPEDHGPEDEKFTWNEEKQRWE